MTQSEEVHDEVSNVFRCVTEPINQPHRLTCIRSSMSHSRLSALALAAKGCRHSDLHIINARFELDHSMKRVSQTAFPHPGLRRGHSLKRVLQNALLSHSSRGTRLTRTAGTCFTRFMSTLFNS